MILVQMTVGGMGNFCYLGKSEATGEGFVVDPAHDAGEILQKAKGLGINLTHVFLTHHHFDHINAAAAVKTRTGAKILAHAGSESLLKGAVALDGQIHDGQEISFGAGETVRFLHTPGHAPGSLCLLVADRWLVTGDTLFIGNCGRTDLPGGSAKDLYESLQRIKALPDSLIVFPGHDYGPQPFRTLGEEKAKSPVLQASSFAAFEAVP